MIAVSLFFVTGILALLLVFMSKKSKNKSMLGYAFACMVLCVLLFFFFVHDDWKNIRSTVREQWTETDTISSQAMIPLREVHVAAKEAVTVASVQLEAPLFEQLPELPRGCELTSLSMLLGFHEIEADKMELAKEVKRNPATFERRDGKVYFGNPNNGFVGDMLSLTTPGLGVYHKPIAQLAEQYAPDLTVKDFTGEDFSAIIEQLQLGRPVWVIINSWYDELPADQFITWHTEDGPIDITYREHSVLITGYDEDFIYFNDPLNYHDKAPRENFQKAWVQMGKQAITIY